MWWSVVLSLLRAMQAACCHMQLQLPSLPCGLGSVLQRCFGQLLLDYELNTPQEGNMRRTSAPWRLQCLCSCRFTIMTKPGARHGNIVETHHAVDTLTKLQNEIFTVLLPDLQPSLSNSNNPAPTYRQATICSTWRWETFGCSMI